MARVSLTPRRSLLFRVTEWYSKRTYGKVLDPARAMAHNPRVLWSDLRFEQSVAKWKSLDADLKALAVMASAAAIGCSWCMDFGHWESQERGMDVRKLHDVPVWRDSDVYTPLERDVMEYAEAMSASPPEVGDELAERLVATLGEAAFVELTAMVAVENLRSRMNAALGLTSQGFKDQCEIPARPDAAAR
ncbi:carboxymuconolactone decarboxylase family protein [Streptomyces lunaelactis]|uniref:carboxymuconolactone decarboxylase family protein n=1 Tax=Streptomyces lunaelactis TaxID=1535768 RepID=UPI001584EC8F|nr:carboxymuconolactone decarboxylase family protein [Streptomyces lunaelactis]NUK11083.1 carboxymuconolactone decarboxylase family protein [Streptomyces lunaelactis]NUK21303.1 carboxymuconolactone decarboxylase family protein [Streptomyces lunaelactis]NUK53657.1 carboxymuconolactone decarboxylase family protein [Streptomyces lunaelactis]NUK60065.1 carboxymuconolactone decarboxylase family protein [Streptomyces lunaelactis]NUK67293.1 carboxymuconolactone decarboxylase family protein [Streptomy